MAIITDFLVTVVPKKIFLTHNYGHKQTQNLLLPAIRNQKQKKSNSCDQIFLKYNSLVKKKL